MDSSPLLSSCAVAALIAVSERGYFGFRIGIAGTRCQVVTAKCWFRSRRVDLLGPAAALPLDRGSDFSAGGVGDTVGGSIAQACRFSFGNIGGAFRQVRASVGRDAASSTQGRCGRS